MIWKEFNDLSIKFKQNGQWVKIPTPSQIDDSAASAATTYSSNKINEIIPQNIAKYLLEHKDELGTDDFTKLKNTPYTLIGKADTKFTSIDTMYSYDTESSSPKQNVDNGLYLLKEDIDFSAKHTMNFYEYVPLSMSGSEEFSYTNWVFTIPKGSTLSVKDTFVTIVCPNSIDYEIKTASGSGGDQARIFMFIATNGDNNVSSFCLTKDGFESPYTYYDAILYNIFSNVENFSEGQPIVTANSYQGSGSMPFFKLGEAGATTTSITDDNYTDYTTTEKLAKLTAGLYYVNTDKLSINLKGVDIKSQISTLFPQTNVDDTIDVEKGSQITVTVRQSGSPETGYQTQKLVNIYNTLQGVGYPYSVFFLDAENNPSAAFISMGSDLINKALSNAYSATNQISEIMNTCIIDESLRGKVPVISVPDTQTATGVKNVFKAMDLADVFGDKFQDNESTSVVLNNHTEYRCKVMASLNLSLPETIPDDYNSRIVFESGETATTLSYTAGSIKFTGDDCDSAGAFIPNKNTSYEVDIKYLGLDSSGNKRIIARVGAF
mgnify:FL=1